MLGLIVAMSMVVLQQGAEDALPRRSHPASLRARPRRRRNGPAARLHSHVFFPDYAAQSIGWPTGSPFQFEVGVHDGAWGVLGFLCIWIGGLFWLATGLGWSLFMLGATYGHIRETVLEGDYALYNFLTLFSDGFIGVWLLLLLYLYWRQGGFQK
jgi:hypothetical protein